jgi:hypothetical protein
MTAMRSVLLAAVLAVAVLLPGGAAAEPPPPYEGATFPTIEGPEGPEEFSWEVHLGEEQELHFIDDRHIGVFFSTGEQSFSITAAEAHDAEGVAVPTTIAITGSNIVTLTVHHRAGNPAAAGAPFDYPVVPGAGWEGGFQTIHVVMPPTEQTAAAPQCTVPDLSGRSLRAARRMLNRSDCALGPIRGERSRGARVVRQYRAAGKSLPVGTEVGVKVLRP